MNASALKVECKKFREKRFQVKAIINTTRGETISVPMNSFQNRTALLVSSTGKIKDSNKKTEYLVSLKCQS